ncbi:MAG: TIR domain-containing protein [Acidobacteriaceae bacterium]|nr:TIR domain-containing protein [Acidobacteriaceae bacterium]MBV9296321.1 TIR domain-containing protein [Acidobacteriaceae bacterium]MBV9765430.1 TIR domain-containing protein [Acidobacteriaceae bacterium]
MNLFHNSLDDPPSRSYALFVSHAWDYRDDYEGIVNLLNADRSFSWENLSVPFNEPLSLPPALPKSHRTILRQLDERIKRTHCLLVLAGMYVAHRGWIQSEIEAAQEYGKPILAIAPRGQERFPEALTQAAHDRASWNSKSIVAAVRKLVPAAATSFPQLATLARPPYRTGPFALPIVPAPSPPRPLYRGLVPPSIIPPLTPPPKKK